MIPVKAIWFRVDVKGSLYNSDDLMGHFFRITFVTDKLFRALFDGFLERVF